MAAAVLMGGDFRLGASSVDVGGSGKDTGVEEKGGRVRASGSRVLWILPPPPPAVTATADAEGTPADPVRENDAFRGGFGVPAKEDAVPGVKEEEEEDALTFPAVSRPSFAIILLNAGGAPRSEVPTGAPLEYPVVEDGAAWV